MERATPGSARERPGCFSPFAKTVGISDISLTRSQVTGYDLGKLWDDRDGVRVSGAKSKKSRTGIPRVMEKPSIESNDGAFTPRSILLRKSIEMSRSSANSS
jgi:hypothetical protein